jgi:hypothetical protein
MMSEQRTVEIGPAQTPSGGSPGGSTARTLTAVLMYVLSAIFILGGAASLIVDSTRRDEAGFLLNTESFELSDPEYAVVATPQELLDYGEEVRVFRAVAGALAVSVRSQDETPVFIGVAATAKVQQYLSGGGSPDAPTEQAFWRTSAVGTGSQVIRLRPTEEDLTIVVMNAEAQRGVAVDATIGVQFAGLKWSAVILLLIGVALAVATALLTRRRSVPRGAPTRE